MKRKKWIYFLFCRCNFHTWFQHFLSVWQFTFTCWRNSDIKFGIHSRSLPTPTHPHTTPVLLHFKSGSVGWQHCFRSKI